MKYFLPDNSDLVDFKYDFLNDTYSVEHQVNGSANDAYIWDIYGINNIPCDGILVSKMLVRSNKKKYEKMLREGVRDVLHLPKSTEIMGDCGAFGYVSEEKPPFKTKEILEYYVKCGFTYGVSIDHLIIPAFNSERKRRWKITIENARKMYELWESKDRFFKRIRIIGVAQGWDPASYNAAVKELLKIGYDYIALGGLARSPTGVDTSGHYTTQINGKSVLNIVSSVATQVRNWISDKKHKVDLHIFGISRPNILHAFNNLGVTSFDSASFLRKAWLGTDNNYFTFDGQSYGALRIPQVYKSKLTRNHKSNRNFKRLESDALDLCRKYDKNLVSFKEALNAIVAYDVAIGEKRTFQKEYERTLMDKPWKDCPCKICQELGIEVMIFRGNNRNRRRGFHNTYSFYNSLRNSYPKILAFTFCTAKKNPSQKLLPAYIRYSASTNMKSFWNCVHDLPIDIGMFSAKFGLVQWNTLLPNYDYKLQKSDIEKYILSLKQQLTKYDKIFFTGLSDYRKIVETIKKENGFDIEIFPKIELARTNGKTRPLDIIEYTRQMKYFRSTILETIPDFNNKVETVTLDSYL